MMKTIIITLCISLLLASMTVIAPAAALAETADELYQQGLASYRKGDFRNSVAVLRRAVSKEPENGKIWRAYNDSYLADSATRFMATLTGTYNGVSYEELVERRKQNPELVVIDLRSPKDYSEEHVPGAVNIPLEELKTRHVELPGLKINEMVVYCAAGPRSATGQMYISMLGYTNVKYLRGGMFAWKSGQEKEKEGAKKKE